MTHYKLRITLNSVNTGSVIELLEKDSKQGYAYVEEVSKGEKEHCHCYVISDIKEATLRMHLRKLTSSTSGNKLYSLVKLDVEETEHIATEYLAYMMKEGEVLYKDFDNAWIEKAKQYDTQVKQELKEKKEKKKSRYQRIIEKFEKDYPDRQYLDIHTVSNWVIEFFVNEQVNVSVSTLSSWVNTIMLRYDISEHRLSIVSVIIRQLTIS